jgi:hypothetical protein
MDLLLKVFGVQSQTINKPERAADGSVTNKPEQISRISAKDDKGNVLQFAVPYADGKSFDLDKEITVSIS